MTGRRAIWRELWTGSQGASVVSHAVYAFPPFARLLMVLDRVRIEKHTEKHAMILIDPYWPQTSAVPGKGHSVAPVTHAMAADCLAPEQGF